MINTHKKILFPSKWENRKPELTQDNVFFIPSYFQAHKSFTLKANGFFKTTEPINIEICSGNGDWVVDKAKNDTCNWIAVEIRIDRINKIFRRRGRVHLEDRLLIVCGDTIPFIENYIVENSISSIYINFPDPWPKARHKKHRLNSVQFFTSLKKILVKTGVLCITSDDSFFLYEAFVNSKLAGFPLHSKKAVDKDFGYSYFKNLWEQKNKECKTLLCFL